MEAADVARRLHLWKVSLALLLAACAQGARPGAPTPTPDTFGLAFEYAEAPGVYSREMLGRRDRAKGAQGLWAAVPGLRRPERAEIENLATGAKVTVALYSGGASGGARLSNAAAEALGIGAEPARVRITAVRREPKLVEP